MIALKEIMKEVYGEDHTDILGLSDAGAALLYLVRRFGYTEYGSDPDKRVCMYVLPTDHPKVQVNISFGGRSAAVGVAMGDPVLAQYYDEDRAPYHAWHERCYAWAESQGKSFSGEFIATDADEAIRTEYKAIEPFPDRDIEPEPGTVKHAVHTAVANALKDLLRPVFVRDVPITIIGDYEGEFGEWLDDDQRYANAVLPHWSAGTGMIQESYRDYDLLYDLLEVLREKGDGDLQRGMALALVGTEYERKEDNKS